MSLSKQERSALELELEALSAVVDEVEDAATEERDEDAAAELAETRRASKDRIVEIKELLAPATEKVDAIISAHGMDPEDGSDLPEEDPRTLVDKLAGIPLPERLAVTGMSDTAFDHPDQDAAEEFPRRHLIDMSSVGGPPEGVEGELLGRNTDGTYRVHFPGTDTFANSVPASEVGAEVAGTVLAHQGEKVVPELLAVAVSLAKDGHAQAEPVPEVVELAKPHRRPILTEAQYKATRFYGLRVAVVIIVFILPAIAAMWATDKDDKPEPKPKPVVSAEAAKEAREQAKVAPVKVAPAKVAPAKVVPAKVAPAKVVPVKPAPARELDKRRKAALPNALLLVHQAALNDTQAALNQAEVEKKTRSWYNY